jgi:3'(2'), 5'-bisphosphate nucleotidase
VEALGRLTPDWPVLSEEGKSIPYQVRSGWERYWLIDPLDGTREFVKRNGEFTVNIALVENGRPTLGVVYAPVLQRCYWGQRGQGAWRQDGDRPAERIAVTCPAAQPRRIVASRSHAGDSLGGMLDRIGPHEVVSMGSSLKLCLVAEGAADFYPRLGPTSEWDTAAAQAVVEAAGGCVTDTAGANLRYNSKESLLNPHFLVFGDPEVPWTSYL